MDARNILCGLRVPTMATSRVDWLKNVEQLHQSHKAVRFAMAVSDVA